MSTTSSTVVEEPVVADATHQLSAILTAPVAASRRTGITLLNAGLLHRVGPYRLYVDLARELSQLGFPVLRIDLAGKGDSPSRQGKPSTQSLLMDVNAAAQTLKRETGATRCVLGGLCSAADDAFLVANKLPGIAGIFMFDGFAPRSAKYYLRRYGPKVLSPKAWRRRLSRREEEADEQGANINLRNWAPPTEMIDRFRELSDNKTHTLAIYTGNAQNVYNYEGQLASVVGASPFLTEHYIPAATHLFPVTAHRKKLLATVSSWMERNFD